MIRALRDLWRAWRKVYLSAEYASEGNDTIADLYMNEAAAHLRHAHERLERKFSR